jgi:hypothetical protein
MNNLEWAGTQTYEEKAIGYDNALEGVRIKFIPYKVLHERD